MHKLTDTLKEQIEIVLKSGMEHLTISQNISWESFLKNVFMELEELNFNRTRNKIANHINYFIKYGSWVDAKNELQRQKDRLDKDNFSSFGAYYSEDLFLVFDLFEIMSVDLYDFHSYLQHNTISNDLNADNLKFCIDNDMLDIWNNFDTSFRGTIETYFKGESDEHLVIRTKEKRSEKGYSYYVPRISRISNYVFDSYESAVMGTIFGDRFSDTLNVLLTENKK